MTEENYCFQHTTSLWEKLRMGDSTAFEQLLTIHYSDLYNYGCHFTRDSEMVKDCIQDLFLILWKNRATLSETTTVKYYLLKSLRRSLLKSIDKSREKNAHFLHMETWFTSSLPVEMDIILEEDLLETATKVRKALSQLSKRQQEIIYLRFYMNLDLPEIAELMTVRRQSVYNLLHDALKSLRGHIDRNAFACSLRQVILIAIGLPGSFQ